MLVERRAPLCAAAGLLCAALGLWLPAQARTFVPTVGSQGKRFVEQLVHGRFDDATRSFDAKMRQALTAAKLSALWRGLEQQLGPFQRIATVRTEAVAGYRVAFVSCVFARKTIDTKVVFSEAGQVSGLFFVPPRAAVTWTPPTYARRAAFVEREVTVGKAPWPLPGTLTLPRDKTRVPGVVLVHGSGPQGRDERVGGARVFKDLAWGLASAGIAVLRYDKRTLVHGQRLAAAKTPLTFDEETVDDALAAAALLRAQPEVDGARLFVLGHSLGGMLAPRIGARARGLAGLIILAGNTRPTPELVVEQVTYLAGLDGKLDAAERAEIAAAKAFRKAALSKDLKPDAELSLFGAKIKGRYWIALRDYDPARAAVALTLPMFIAQGERDYQVTLQDLAGWKRALGRRKNVTFKQYPRLNHLFVAGAGQPSPAEYERGGNVDAQVVADLAHWIGATR